MCLPFLTIRPLPHPQSQGTPLTSGARMKRYACPLWPPAPDGDGCAPRRGRPAGAPLLVRDTAERTRVDVLREPIAVHFSNLKSGRPVRSPFWVEFGVRGMGVIPAGNPREQSGHHHILIDTRCRATTPLPSRSRHAPPLRQVPDGRPARPAAGYIPCACCLPTTPTGLLRLQPRDQHPGHRQARRTRPPSWMPPTWRPAAPAGTATTPAPARPRAARGLRQEPARRGRRGQPFHPTASAWWGLGVAPAGSEVRTPATSASRCCAAVPRRSRSCWPMAAPRPCWTSRRRLRAPAQPARRQRARRWRARQCG